MFPTAIILNKEKSLEILRELKRLSNENLYSKGNQYWRYYHGASICLELVISNKLNNILKELEVYEKWI